MMSSIVQRYEKKRTPVVKISAELHNVRIVSGLRVVCESVCQLIGGVGHGAPEVFLLVEWHRCCFFGKKSVSLQIGRNVAEVGAFRWPTLESSKARAA